MEKVKNIKESVRDILKNYKREPTHKQIFLQTLVTEMVQWTVLLKEIFR